MLIIFILIQCSNGLSIFLNKTLVQDFCVYHPINTTITLSVENQKNSALIEWKINDIKILSADATYEECMTEQFQKKAYLDWYHRLGTQVLSQKYYWNFTLISSGTYKLIQFQDNQSIKTQEYGSMFIIEGNSLTQHADYFISVFEDYQLQQTIQIRILNKSPVLIPSYKVSVEKILSEDQTNFTLEASKIFDWTIYLKTPTRFMPISQSYLFKNTDKITLSVTGTWPDKLYIITLVLYDRDQDSQYYQVDWVHQMGQQWRSNSTNISCSYEELNNSMFLLKYFCLEWSSTELNVLLPEYSYLSIENETIGCEHGLLQLAYQPKSYCICANNFTGTYCQDQYNQNTTVSIFVQEIFDDIKNKSIDNNTYLRTIYLLSMQYQEFDNQLFESLVTRTTDDYMSQLLILDNLAIKSIINSNGNLAQNVYELTRNLMTFKLQFGLVEFTQFSSRGASINQLDYNPLFILSRELNYKSFQDSVYTRCIFLNNTFVYALLIKFSSQLSFQINQNSYSSYVDCLTYSENKNLIRSIPINLTIPLAVPLNNIQRPTQLMCQSNTTKCRLLKLTSVYGEADSKMLNGPFIIQRSLKNKTFDYQQIVQSILKPNFSATLLVYIIRILVF